MKKSQCWITAICLWTLLLTGCGTAKVPDEIGKTTVAIEEDGQIRYWLTGEFDKEYYDISELNQMAVEEVQNFNAEKQYSVVVENVRAADGDEDSVIVQYLFDNWGAYTAFNEESLFYGTIADARLRGYKINAEFVDVKDSGIYTAEEVIDSNDRYIVITNVRADVYLPEKVTHVSVGVSLNEDGSVNTAEAEGLVSILLK